MFDSILAKLRSGMFATNELNEIPPR